jgi:hypothetical protein
MKKTVVLVFVCVIALLSPSFVLGQFGMGCCEFGPGWGAAGRAGTCVTVGNVKVVPWLGFGYQSMSVNVNYPFSGTHGLIFQNLDVSLKNNALWVGSLGLDVALRQRLRLYGGAGTNLFVSNPGSVGTSTYVDFAGLFAPGGLDWSGSQLRWWELNLGGLYCLTDDVAILIGYKCDRLTENLGRDEIGFLARQGSSVQDYSGDFQIITRSPYIGIKICQSHLDFSLVWSPWLTSYDVKIPLRVVNRVLDAPQFFASDSYWRLSGGGGNLLEAFAQTKLNIREHLGVNLWLRGSWLQCRGNGNLDQSMLHPNVFMSDTGSSSDSLFRRYLWSLGISGQLMF